MSLCSCLEGKLSLFLCFSFWYRRWDLWAGIKMISMEMSPTEGIHSLKRINPTQPCFSFVDWFSNNLDQYYMNPVHKLGLQNWTRFWSACVLMNANSSLVTAIPLRYFALRLKGTRRVCAENFYLRPVISSMNAGMSGSLLLERTRVPRFFMLPMASGKHVISFRCSHSVWSFCILKK